MYNMRTSARCAAILLGLLLGGCYTTTATRAEGVPEYPAVRMEDVRVFPNATGVPPHEVIGTVAIKGESGFLSNKTLFAYLRRKAGSIGANAIIMQELTFPEGAQNSISSLVPGLVYRRGTALAIRYKEEQK